MFVHQWARTERTHRQSAKVRKAEEPSRIEQGNESKARTLEGYDGLLETKSSLPRLEQKKKKQQQQRRQKQRKTRRDTTSEHGSLGNSNEGNSRKAKTIPSGGEVRKARDIQVLPINNSSEEGHQRLCDQTVRMRYALGLVGLLLLFVVHQVVL
mmetsp:Transcript_17886/g.30440  ORF Transcript_17886/g.30440 Transcript_17886/m.30440 type:complete len:154 (-) Transcript_17886:21-482(-)